MKLVFRAQYIFYSFMNKCLTKFYGGCNDYMSFTNPRLHNIITRSRYVTAIILGSAHLHYSLLHKWRNVYKNYFYIKSYQSYQQYEWAQMQAVSTIPKDIRIYRLDNSYQKIMIDSKYQQIDIFVQIVLGNPFVQKSVGTSC